MIQNAILSAWETRATSDIKSNEGLIAAIDSVLDDLNKGKLRVCENIDGLWTVNEWVKQAILLSFAVYDNQVIASGTNNSSWYDKVPLKCENWQEVDFERAGFRFIPGAWIRRGSFIGKGAVVMPSFINIGAYVGEGTLVDTWATVGSCAQIGKNVHLSGGVGIGGVLEPLQAKPVIIEDNCFIGARSEVTEGVIVEEGAVLAMGVYLSQSTKIVNRQTGEISYGRIPAYSVVVPGSLPDKNGGPALNCAVIIKQVDERTRSKTGINELLRIDA